MNSSPEKFKNFNSILGLNPGDDFQVLAEKVHRLYDLAPPDRQAEFVNINRLPVGDLMQMEEKLHTCIQKLKIMGLREALAPTQDLYNKCRLWISDKR